MAMGNARWKLVDNTAGDLLQQPLSCKRGQPTWYPLIPKGRFQYQDPKTGDAFEFVITDEVLTDMVNHLKGPQRAYGGCGIPCDQDNLHTGYDDPQYKLPVEEDGADLWAKDLEVRDGWLWAEVEPTTKGEPKIESRPYLSPVFAAGEGVDPKYGLKNFIRNLTLVSQPWFWPQPGLMVAASMNTFALHENAEDGTDGTGTGEGATQQVNNEQPEGGTKMTPEEIAELEQKLADATEQLETATARVTELEAEVTQRDEQITELQGRVEAAETASADLTTRLEAIEAQLAETNQEQLIAQKVNEIMADTAEEVIPLEGGGTATELRAPTKEYATIAASAFIKGDSDSMQALNVFLKANGNRIPTQSVGEKPNLQVIPASMHSDKGAPKTDAEKLDAALAAGEFTEKRGKEIAGLMTSGMAFEAAREKAFRGF